MALVPTTTPPFRIPENILGAALIERPDTFVANVFKLIKNLPWFLEAPIRAALFAAQKKLSLRGLDLFDPWSWRKHGFNENKPICVWASDRFQIGFIAINDQRQVDQYLRSVLKQYGYCFRDDRQHVLVTKPQVDVAGAAQITHGAWGFVDGYLWVAVEGSTSKVDELVTLLNAPPSEFCPPLDELRELDASDAALRVIIRESNAGRRVQLAAALEIEEKQIRISGHMPRDSELAKTAQYFCRRAETHNIALPAGALAVCCGFDLGNLLLDNKSGDTPEPAVPVDPAAPIERKTEVPSTSPGSAIIVLHELSDRVSSAIEKATTLDDFLAAEPMQVSLWVHPNERQVWESWMTELAKEQQVSIAGSGNKRAYGIPVPREDKAPPRSAIWVGWDRGAVIGSLTLQGLDEIRASYAGWTGGFQSSIDDDEIAEMLQRGEPFLYVQVAKLAERLTGLVFLFAKDGLLAKSFGVHEVLQLLRRVRDVSAHMELGKDDQVGGWARLRLT
ncbi:MAG: hypothetical protein U0165_20690 [Polyangiaceae bacterium]